MIRARTPRYEKGPALARRAAAGRRRRRAGSVERAVKVCVPSEPAIYVQSGACRVSAD